METLSVALGSRTYPIHIGAGILAAAELYRPHLGGGAAAIVTNAVVAPLYLQRAYPDRESAEAYIVERIARDIPTRDANDLIYQLESSRNYDPEPRLESISVPMTWVNSGDDFINPPYYGIAEDAARRMPTARYILIRATSDTRGHGTHTWAKFWRQELIDLLARTEG